MCGISGVFNLHGEPVEPEILRHMNSVISHRGPDGDGIYINDFIGLAHRRLAILDLSRSGHQPMLSNDKNYVITYNGEVYNFKELRAELVLKGYTFNSNTDTEVVLCAWVEWGVKSVEKLNGMYAFAVWDIQRCELTLVRDRYGIKPLYYFFKDNTLVFGSEIKAILASSFYEFKIDKAALLEYFTFQNYFTQKTLFDEICILQPATILTIKLGARAEPKQYRYWDYNFSESEKVGSVNEYIEEFDVLFRNAISRQLMSDVEVGSYLSGGIDSGAITAISAKQLPYLKSFTCGFDMRSASGLELGFDEREKAEYMSYLFKTEHYEMVLKAGDMERCMERLVYHLEEPRVGQSYPNYYAAQLAGKFLKVVLAGTGSDELFGGYPWRYFRSVSANNYEDYIDSYYNYWQRLIPDTLAEKIFSPIWGDIKHIQTRDIFREVFAQNSCDISSPEACVNNSLYFEAKTFLHGLLVVEDKLSMAHGLESRLPFLDNDVVDFAMKLPLKLKIDMKKRVEKLNENDPGPKSKKYFEKTRDGKLLLRQALKQYIPNSLSSVKQGFSAPDASWFRGESIEYVRATLMTKDSLIYEYLDYQVVLSLINEHIAGVSNRRLLIWSLLYFECWLRTFVDGVRCVRDI